MYVYHTCLSTLDQMTVHAIGVRVSVALVVRQVLKTHASAIQKTKLVAFSPPPAPGSSAASAPSLASAPVTSLPAEYSQGIELAVRSVAIVHHSLSMCRISNLC